MDFFMLVLSPNAKDRQLTLSVFRSGIQLVYPYSTTTMYSSAAVMPVSMVTPYCALAYSLPAWIASAME